MDEVTINAIFVFWFFCATLPLFTLVRRFFSSGRDPVRPLLPTAYYIFSFLFGMTVTGTLFWLYTSNHVEGATAVWAGCLIFIPEAIYIFWALGLFGGKKIR